MPGTGGVASYGDLLITSLVVLAGVCIAAFIVVKVVGRFLATGRIRGGHLLDVVARLPLEPRRSLYVVEVAGKTLLVGTSEMGLSVLSELDGNEVKARAVPKQSFGEMVRAAWVRRRSVDVPAETRSAHVGADEKDPSSMVATSDVSAETRGVAGDAAENDAARASSAELSRDVSAGTQRAHVGASDRSAKATSTAASRSTPVASRDASAATPSAHVGINDNDAPSSARSGEVSAGTPSAGATSEREDS